jgi:hypothetical protein
MTKRRKAGIVAAFILIITLVFGFTYFINEAYDNGFKEGEKTGLIEGRHQVYYVMLNVSNAQRNLDSAVLMAKGDSGDKLVAMYTEELTKEKKALAKYMGYPEKTFYPWIIQFHEIEGFKDPDEWYYGD